MVDFNKINFSWIILSFNCDFKAGPQATQISVSDLCSATRGQIQIVVSAVSFAAFF